MVKLVSNRGTDEMPFCSQSCLDLFNETKDAVLVTFNEDPLKPFQQTEYRQFVPALPVRKERQAQSSCSIATQTDFVYSCKCNKENTRKKLVATKRLAFDGAQALQKQIKQEFGAAHQNKLPRRKA